MIENIDKNRIRFEFLGVEKEAAKMGLLTPIGDVPMKNAASTIGVQVDLFSVENQEPLVPLDDYGIRYIPYYKKFAQFNPTYNNNIVSASETIYVREGIAKKMWLINKKLSVLDIELICYEGYRSPKAQKNIFKVFMKTAMEKGISEKKAKEFARQYYSDPNTFDRDNPDTWTIHSTGGAVDVYLFDSKTKKIIDLGEKHFDNPIKATHTRYFEALLEDRKLKPSQIGFLNSRRILYNAMTNGKDGFVNFGYEIYHYSYKDPYYALIKDEDAKYGYKEAPADSELTNMLALFLR